MDFSDVSNVPEFQLDFMLLPEVIQSTVFSYCDFKTKMNLSETCTHLHNLLWSSTKLCRRIRLSCRPLTMQTLNVVQENQKRGRKYRRVKIYQFRSKLSVKVMDKLIETANFLGESVRDLEVDLGFHKNEDIVRLLQCFPMIEKLFLDSLNDEESLEYQEQLSVNGILSQLKELNVDSPNSMILKVVENIDTLERFTYQNTSMSENFKYGVKNLEDLIIKQNRLKELKIYGMELNPLFEKNRIEEISFQLENFFAVCFFIHRNNVINFFKHQKNIRNLHLIGFFERETFHLDRPNYTNILSFILSLPKLETIVIGHAKTILPEDFDVLRCIRNKSVKSIEYLGGSSMVVENFFNIFPCLEKLNFDGKDVNLSNLSMENFQKVTSTRIFKFSFTPSFAKVSGNQFEDVLIEFIKRHREIQILVIGQKDWLGSEIGVSLDFIRKIAESLKNLEFIEVFNPLELNQSITLLNHVYSHKFHI